MFARKSRWLYVKSESQSKSPKTRNAQLQDKGICINVCKILKFSVQKNHKQSQGQITNLGKVFYCRC